MIRRNRTISMLIALTLTTSTCTTYFLTSNPLSVSAEVNTEIKAPQLGVNSVDEVISAMTLYEKANLLVGGNKTTINNEPIVGGQSNTVPGAAGSTQAIPRLGIPSITLADGPAGLRISPTRENDDATYYCTAFPVATALASTWDTDLVTKVGESFGQEIKEYGVDILLSPALNIHRNILCGRNFEYYSEDPLIAGSIASALTNGVQSNGVGVSLKHFAANNQETNRMGVSSVVTERALREIYLRGFEQAVEESSPWTIMSSYNKINGTYTSESKDLLTDILRGEWGFNGLVMTDWFGGTDTVAGVNAQNDLFMPGRPAQIDAIVKGVNSGLISEDTLNRNVKNMLNLILKTPTFQNYNFTNKPNLEANAEVSRNAATEGMVLLKNENKTLPIKDSKNVALYGNYQIETVKGGTGSGDVNVEHIVSILEGFQNSNFNLYSSLSEEYSNYMDYMRSLPEYSTNVGWWQQIPVVPEMEISYEAAKVQAKTNDYAVVVIGRNSGEGKDRTATEGDYYLTAQEKSNLENISKAYREAGKKVVVLLNIGGVIETESWKNLADSILLTWQPGQEAGDAIVDVVSGKVNPSGKLATTFPKDYSDIPSSTNFPGNDPAKPTEVIYEEDIYVGYRYFSTFNVEPSYEFGYGLSYTTFKYDKLKVNKSPSTDTVNISVTVTNTGDVAGKEVVQVYFNEPENILEKPELQLRAYDKTDLLQPGESQTITFNLTTEDFKSYNTADSTWIVEKGMYTVNVGSSIKNIKATKKFNLPKTIVVKDVTNELSPTKEINTLTKN